MHTLRRYYIKIYYVTQTFIEVAELLQLLRWRERAKKQSCQEHMWNVRNALSRLLCHWCCLTVLIAPAHSVFPLSTWCFLFCFLFLLFHTPSSFFLMWNKASLSTLTSFFSPFSFTAAVAILAASNGYGSSSGTNSSPAAATAFRQPLKK